MMWFKRIAVPAIALVMMASSAYARSWEDYTDRSDFPAYVSEISGFPVTMNAELCVVWGSWDVCFADQPPVAELTQCDYDYCPTIMIRNLECTNPVLGSHSCDMFLSNSLDRDIQDFCGVYLTGSDAEANFTIKCPGNLILQ